ncbi:MAG: M48 family metallopeptidase [Candidatus Pacebacteria bacterium]|nr:M48 family metallopeptidase [Candidatus Paceibacterota bacterium]MCF7862532.1 M48 family metallopeptidase [Candidatus Paceibacterota bacterium]
MSMFFVVVIGLGWFFSYYYQNPNLLYGFVLFSIGMNIFSYWFSDKVVLSLSKAKPASREAYFDLYTSVENLAITAGLPMPKVYIIEDSSPNAFATGRNEKHAVVAVTTGLLSILEKNELEGVIAHELAHIGNKDMLLSTVVVVLVGFVTILSDMFLRAQFFGISGRDSDSKHGNFLALAGIILAILAPIFALLLQLAISRKREFLADATGAMLTRYPEGLANALKKISSQNIPMKVQSNAISHLYISDPVGGKKKHFSSIFSTHPPVEERVKALLG